MRAIRCTRDEPAPAASSRGRWQTETASSTFYRNHMARRSRLARIAAVSPRRGCRDASDDVSHASLQSLGYFLFPRYPSTLDQRHSNHHNAFVRDWTTWDNRMPATTFPSPKLSQSDRIKRPLWYRFYAMFSEEFAEQVIRHADLPPRATVLDPWLGAGTTASAAIAAGHTAIGIDINPVMVIVARGRVADGNAVVDAIQSASQAVKRLGRFRLAPNDPLLQWFGINAATTLRKWDRAIRNGQQLDALCNAECLVMTSVFEAALQMGAAYRSKNPTWMKCPDAARRVEMPPGEVSQLIMLLAKDRLNRCTSRHGEISTALRLGSATNLNIETSSVDFVLTSPPYCTRIDYAVGTRIELALLGLNDSELRDLRDRTMGTSTVRKTSAVPQDAWGDECCDFVAKVQTHHSKSSESYYLKTYLQYFDDLSHSLAEISRCLKHNGQAVVVVQNSYYKGICTDLAKMVVEMCGHRKMQVTKTHDFAVTQNMRQVNTRSRKYGDHAEAVESVLWLKKKG